MPTHQYLHRVVDLTDPNKCRIHNMTVDAARERVASGDSESVRAIDGHFAIVARRDRTIRMARSLGIPMRYFLAKQADGPMLIVAHRIDAIYDHLKSEGLADQFHPSYTRMAPAHYITELELIGCPDPAPAYQRFFTPERAALPPNEGDIGRRYIAALKEEIAKHLRSIPADAPVGVCFSGGVDSGAVLLTTYHVLLETGSNPGRLKAFTLSVDGGGEDVAQARAFLERVGLGYLLEVIDVSSSDLDPAEAIAIVEDYKPLDIQAATMMLALGRGIQQRYPTWKHLIDGDGGDENLKDYAIEENPELTIRSVLNNPLLYHEGWGVGSFKHSETYSGGLSRSYARTYATLDALGLSGFSPFTLPRLVEIAEGIPFIEMTDWRHDRLYALKGRIVALGVKAITGLDMPDFPKRRFQHGAASAETFGSRFADSEMVYRRRLLARYDG